MSTGMQVAWRGDETFKAAEIARLRELIEADRFARGVYWVGGNACSCEECQETGLGRGCFIGASLATALAQEQGIDLDDSDDLGSLNIIDPEDAMAERWSIPVDLADMLERVFELAPFPAHESARLCVDLLEMVPVNATWPAARALTLGSESRAAARELVHALPRMRSTMERAVHVMWADALTEFQPADTAA